jgi:D-alanyl-D-alanine carboxypeptidase/D-alanyl-D-alanine-endopeptidase (penicillin-binding protein 4)
MIRKLLLFPLLLIYSALEAQQVSISRFLSDSSIQHASVSLCIIDANTGEIIAEHESRKSLSQASVMKLITSAAALEILGPDYTFKTIIGYTGEINRKHGILNGDIIIKGGGDPALASENFPDHYINIFNQWVEDINNIGIRRINGGVITDDSYYDYQPVPPGWNWEDIGNYYGAGVYGLSIFDNTIKIHFKTGEEGSVPVITGIFPEESGMELVNYLTASGTSDQGYVFSSPYSQSGWIAGTIPVNREDFVLKASAQDPPLLAARILSDRLSEAGIKVRNEPTTSRIFPLTAGDHLKHISTTVSPPLSAIIEVLNHESVNLYAEHLLKELGKVARGDGSITSGKMVVNEFLDTIGVEKQGMFIDDGSGLSPQDAINSRGLVTVLYYMRNNGRYFDDYLRSLPEAGKEGTLKSYFRDEVFENRLKAKSGSMTRVRSYAGYFETYSGREMMFSIIVDNFTGPSGMVVSGIEEIIKEYITYW